MAGENFSALNNDDEQLTSRIKENYATMTKNQKKIARFILEHQEQIKTLSITRLADATSTSISTITRFCQILQYSGFSEFKFHLQNDILPTTVAADPILDSDSIFVMQQKIEQATKQALLETYRILDEKTLASVSDAIIRANAVHIYAIGGAKGSSEVAVQLFMQAGILSCAFNEATSMVTVPLWLKRGDVAIGITYSGNSLPVLESLQRAKKRGAITVGISGTPNSVLSREVHYFLGYCYGIPDDLRYLQIARICEVSVIGMLQLRIIASGKLQSLIPQIKEAIVYNRKN